MEPRGKRPRRPDMRRQVVEAGEKKNNKENGTQFHRDHDLIFQIADRSLPPLTIVSSWMPFSLPGVRCLVLLLKLAKMPAAVCFLRNCLRSSGLQDRPQLIYLPLQLRQGAAVA
jgi:hypothetical protein